METRIKDISNETTAIDDSGTSNKEKASDVSPRDYNMMENIIVEILWCSFFFLTLFNMAFNGGESLVFYHMRIVIGKYSIIYAVLSFVLIVLSNFVFHLKRSFFVDLFTGIIPAGVTLSIYYFKVNKFADAAVVFTLIFIFVGGVCIIKKKDDRYIEYTRFFLSLGILSVIVCSIFIVYQKKMPVIMYQPSAQAQELQKYINDSYPSFKKYIEGNESELQIASNESFRRAGESGMSDVQDILQVLLDYEMAYLGIEERLTVVVDNTITGVKMSFRDDRTIYMNASAIDKLLQPDADPKSCFEIYQALFTEGAEYYCEVLSDKIVDENDGSPLLFYREMEVMHSFYDEYSENADDALSEDQYNDYWRVLHKPRDIGWDMAFDIYEISNDTYYYMESD